VFDKNVVPMANPNYWDSYET